jgi:hypothetical protein
LLIRNRTVYYIKVLNSPHSSCSSSHDQNASVGIFREPIQYLLALQCGAVSVDAPVVPGVETIAAQVNFDEIERACPTSENDTVSS